MDIADHVRFANCGDFRLGMGMVLDITDIRGHQILKANSQNRLVIGKSDNIQHDSEPEVIVEDGEMDVIASFLVVPKGE